MQNIKDRTIEASYRPSECGVKIIGEDIIAYVRFIRMGADKEYDFYGDDADAYMEFEREGFTKAKEVRSLEQANNWIKQELMIGG